MQLADIFNLQQAADVDFYLQIYTTNELHPGLSISQTRARERAPLYMSLEDFREQGLEAARVANQAARLE